MPDCTPGVSWPQFLVSLSPALAGLLSATALWVASRARTTSQDAQQTSQAAVTLSLLAAPSHAEIVSAQHAPARKKS